MPHLQTHHAMHKEAALHDSTFFFVGPFDDNTFFRGPQLVKPVKLHPLLTATTTEITAPSMDSSLAASPVSAYADDEDFAVLGEDDEAADDELPPSPRRRHSGAMSISEEDLPFCYDRAALRREREAHLARHQQRRQSCAAAAEPGAFATHERWDAETDGPSMALWVPEGGANKGGESKRRRVEKANTMPAPARGGGEKRRVAAPAAPRRHSAEVEGPMMALWGI